jgi:D-alanyl-D-alanine carboxypeptidase
LLDLRLSTCVQAQVKARLSFLSRLLWGLVVTAALLGLVAFRVTSCAPAPRLPPPAQIAAAPPPRALSRDCRAPGWEHAADVNASSLAGLYWAPFGRDEIGWRIYAPLIAREIGVDCPPHSTGFARALAAWQKRQGFDANGLVSQLTFIRMKGVVQSRRPFVLLSAQGVCAAPADEAELATGRADEGFGGKIVQLRPGAFAAYRRMVAAARAEEPAIAADPALLQIFSGYRSPAYDAARCAAQNNCNGLERATCSPHRTGLAMDLYLGHAEGFGADSSADPNRLYMTQSPTYRWLLANADRFGFVNYPFEPWHWEWTGENPKAP